MGVFVIPAGSRIRPTAVLAYMLAWTLVALFFVSREILRRLYWDEPLALWNTLVMWFVGEYIWAILALFVIWFANRLPLERPWLQRRLLVHLVVSIAVAASQLAVEAVAYLQLGVLRPAVSGSFWDAWPAILVVGFHSNMIVYWVMLGVLTLYRYSHRLQQQEQDAFRLELNASELQTQLIEARLSALKMQLQPHFLFNTLNAIMVLVRQQDAARAEEMLGRLGDLLRCVLDEGEAQEVPLHRELDYVRLYLSIEQVRFEERLNVTISIDPAVLDAAVPHMALQPIVENALRHGIARTSLAGTIQISASAAGESVVIRVKDDGPGLRGADASDGWGIGLANTRARLAQLYGDAASLTMHDSAPGVIVTMTLPRHAAPEDQMKETMHVAQFADR